jgi:hypothetical protein
LLINDYDYEKKKTLAGDTANSYHAHANDFLFLAFLVLSLPPKRGAGWGRGAQLAADPGA